MRTLSLKLLLAFMVVSVLGTAIFFGIARWNSNREIQNFLADQDQTEIVARAAAYYLENGSWEGFGKYWMPSPSEQAGSNGRPGSFTPFTLVNVDKHVVFGRGGHKGAGQSGMEQSGELVSDEELKDALEITSEGELVGWLLVTPIDWREAAPGTPIFKSMDQLLIYSALGSIVVATVLGLVLSRTLSRPLQELSEAAKQAATGDLSQKVTVNSRDEIGALATSFNQMMEDLERLMSARKQMTADIAHELRTPISVILGYAEGVYEGVMEPSPENFEIIRDEALRLERLVKDLKILSQADVGELPLEKSEVEVSELISMVERTIQTKLQEKDVVLKIEAAPDLPNLVVDPNRILQAMRNILENGIRHTPEGSRISLKAGSVGDVIRFSIQDSGQGIVPDELDSVFRRFYRTDSARTRDREGSGLGLAITRSVIEQHGGKIWAESPPGEGLEIIFELPIDS